MPYSYQPVSRSNKAHLSLYEQGAPSSFLAPIPEGRGAKTPSWFRVSCDDTSLPDSRSSWHSLLGKGNTDSDSLYKPAFGGTSASQHTAYYGSESFRLSMSTTSTTPDRSLRTPRWQRTSRSDRSGSGSSLPVDPPFNWPTSPEDEYVNSNMPYGNPNQDMRSSLNATSKPVLQCSKNKRIIGPELPGRAGLAQNPQGWGSWVHVDRLDTDDWLHQPTEQDDHDFVLCSPRGIANMGCLIILLLALITLFLGWPLYQYYSAKH